MPRRKQVKNLATAAALRAHLDEIGVDIPIDDEVNPAGPLAQPLEITDGSAGSHTAPNRWAVLPMEGWDGEDDGRPSDLVRRRWDRFAASGGRAGVGGGHRGPPRWPGQPPPTGARPNHR